ncbi:60S ribosomal subunit assembly/export protein [Lachnellula occidentalis]|uniref:60S ribosomal subunit assembly/export protein n=1 Tax=Lachnellula occidentalis TaxID=215460 RepID=A0A8H8S755_9HELO|nr:60S ribosomal subunit assembly/export protein [Lachnellula occidentalis]
MAPSRTSTVKSKHAANKSGIKNSKTISKSKSSSDPVSKPKKKEQQSKGVQKLKKGEGRKKRRIYTEKELDIPQLNMITPVGVEKPKGKKKGKVFVDDRESMMTILAMVNADKEGQIESKMMKARHMEELRDARKAEAERKMEVRKSKLDDTKEGLRKKRKRSTGAVGEEESVKSEAAAGTKPLKRKKSVSFA